MNISLTASWSFGFCDESSVPSKYIACNNNRDIDTVYIVKIYSCTGGNAHYLSQKWFIKFVDKIELTGHESVLL